MVLPLRLLADDLTGALDSAAAFGSPAAPLPVVWRAEAVPGEGGLAFDTGTRERPAAEAAGLAPAGSTHTVARLRAQLERVQGRRLDAPVLPVHPALASLLPGGGLRPGSAYSLPRSTSVLLALLAQPSQAGSWCGVIGMPRLGAEAAEGLGVDLSRLVLIPDPGARWLAVTSTVAEVLPVVAVRPTGRAADGEIARLAARLRDRGAVLLVQGPWPQAEAVLEVGEPTWEGVGRGHGYLAGREVTLTASSRRWPRSRRARVMLPDAAGHVSAPPERMRPVEALHRDDGAEAFAQPIRAVG